MKLNECLNCDELSECYECWVSGDSSSAIEYRAKMLDAEIARVFEKWGAK